MTVTRKFVHDLAVRMNRRLKNEFPQGNICIKRICIRYKRRVIRLTLHNSI